MAERVGFEPTCPFGQDAFEAPPLRPLRYLSARVGPRSGRPEPPIIAAIPWRRRPRPTLPGSPSLAKERLDERAAFRFEHPAHDLQAMVQAGGFVGRLCRAERAGAWL